MVDTAYLFLTQNEVQGVDFLEETPCYLKDVWESRKDGLEYITGKVGNLVISVNRYRVKVKDGSLCKYYMGDNYKTLERKDIKMAFEMLSDALHLPMNLASITRLDLAQNFCTRYPPEVYFNHLGFLNYATRLQEPNGLYYKQTGGRLAFYNKNKEHKTKREPIPDLYVGRNVLRYEQRYTTRVAKQLNVEKVTGDLLYSEDFFVGLLNRWRDKYKQIQKINDVIYNFQAMKTKLQLYRMGVLSLVENAGGQVEMITQISEAQKRGELTKKQAYDLRQAIVDACKIRDGLIVKSDAISELDKKIGEAVMYYR